MANRSRRRRLLFEKDPHCSLCGIELVYLDGPSKTSEPDNSAVLYSTVTKDVRDAVGMPKTALGCKKCVNEMNAEKHQALGIEELRLRSSPQGMCECPTCGNRHIKSVRP